jgi:hypothetical protein
LIRKGNVRKEMRREKRITAAEGRIAASSAASGPFGDFVIADSVSTGIIFAPRSLLNGFVCMY